MFDWYLHRESLHNAIISLRDLQEKISMSKETKDNLSNHGHVKLADLAPGLYMLSVETEEKRQSLRLSLQTNGF